MSSTKEMFDFIDACNDPQKLEEMNNSWGDPYLVNMFWKCANLASNPKIPAMDRRKAMIKARYINFCYSARVPITPKVHRFTAPHGFRGILISVSASIGTGCTIFQHVTIGSNTLLDSKSAGSPVIGNNVYIGAGAKIIGNVKIGNNVRIGAGCFVAEDIEDNTVVIQSRASQIHRVQKLDNRYVTRREFKRLKQATTPPRIHTYTGIESVMDLPTQEKFDSAFRILFCGDLILLEDQVKNAFDGQNYNFSSIFEYTKDYIRDADLSIGVFEGPTGGNRKNYSQSNYADGKSLYLNYPDEFVDDVKNAGFDLVTNATNHVLDMGEAGALRTIDVLKSKGLNYLGLYSSLDDKNSNRVKIIEKDGLKIALLAYTYGTNGYKTPDLLTGKLSYLTSFIINPKNANYEQVRKSVEADFIEAKKYSPDLIVVLPHWGTQFADVPDDYQKAWTENFIQFGADIILGDHTHSVQPVEIQNINGRNVFTAYCPGNFVNIYRERNGDASSIIEVYIDRSSKKIIGGSIIPMWIQSPLNGNYRALPIYKIMTDPELKKSVSTDDMYRINQVLDHVTKVMLNHESKIDLVQEKYFFDKDSILRKKINSLKIDETDINQNILGLIKNSKATCFIGDSITEGTRNGLIPWFEPIEDLFSGEIINFSKGGATTRFLLRNIDKISKITADLFIVAIGTNDVRYRKEDLCAMTKETYVENLQKLRDSISKNNPNCKFIFIAPWISTDGDKNSALKYRDKIAMNLEYTSALKDWCQKNSDLFVDANIYIDKFLKQYPHSKYMIDWIHPNGRDGVRLYSEAFLKSQ